MEWISVNDRLPPIGKNVLLCFLSYGLNVGEGERVNEDRWVQYRLGATIYKGNVTHWIQLPEPPKGD